MIRIKELQKITNAVYFYGIRAEIRYEASTKCKLAYHYFAHAHLTKPYKGRICFSWYGLNRNNLEILETLAHELAHLRNPSKGHKSKKFQKSCREIYLDIADYLRRNKGRI